MRSDLDAARGVVWWTLAGVVLWLAFGSCAFSQVVVSCTNAALEGQSSDSCAGGSYVLLEPGEVEAGSLVSHCVLPATSSPGCVSGMAFWVRAGHLAPTDGVYFEDYGGYSAVYESAGWPVLADFGGGGGGGGGGEGDGWSLEELNLPVFAGVFATFFSICGLFWALGKGVGLIVNFTRRM